MAQNIVARCDQFYAERDNRTDLIYAQPQEPVLLAASLADEWASTAVGQLTFLWLCSLIARMGRRYNRLQVWLSQEAANSQCLIPGVAAPNLAAAVLGHLQGADPCGAYEWAERPAEGTFVVSVGDLPAGVDGRVVRPQGWEAALGEQGALAPAALVAGVDMNPVGAALAAALGAAAVYLHFNRELLSRYEPQSPLWLSAHHSAATSTAGDAAAWPQGPRLPADLDLGRILVVGAGALGGNMLAILGALEGLRGRVEVADDDPLELSNLNRLVVALLRHLRQFKAHIAAESLSGSSVEVVAHLKRFERLQAVGAADRLPLETYDAVVSGVDQMASRAFIQSGWPRLLIDGGTGGFTWRVSTFPSASGGACAGCLAGNSQRNFNELRAPMRCAGGQADQGVQTFQPFESYGFVSFLGAAFLSARVLQRALGLLPTNESVSVEADALFLVGMQRKILQKSERCLCLCGHPEARAYRAAKYA